MHLRLWAGTWECMTLDTRNTTQKEPAAGGWTCLVSCLWLQVMALHPSKELLSERAGTELAYIVIMCIYSTYVCVTGLQPRVCVCVCVCVWELVVKVYRHVLTCLHVIHCVESFLVRVCVCVRVGGGNQWEVWFNVKNDGGVCDLCLGLRPVHLSLSFPTFQVKMVCLVRLRFRFFVPVIVSVCIVFFLFVMKPHGTRWLGSWNVHAWQNG